MRVPVEELRAHSYMMKFQSSPESTWNIVAKAIRMVSKF